MADTETPKTDAEKPVSTRRRAPRKVVAPKAAPASSTAKPTASAKAAATKTAMVETPAADKAATATRSKTTTKPAPKPAPKPRSTKRSAPHPTSTRKSPAKRVTTKPTETIGAKWGVAAIAGSVAVVGVAAVGALLSLRGSTPKAKSPAPTGRGAHQADGTDSSRSFEAGIADEGTIPE